jgi:3-hydroxyacyl-CoA dehydrogenase
MRDTRRVVVLGANGTMGSGSGALFAARGFDVAMLARTADKAMQGLERARAAVRSDVIQRSIRCGSYDDLEKEVADADLVLEAVSENMDVKAPFFDRIDRARKPGTVVATVSSGLSIAEMARGRTDDFRRHFLGMHLFNPPNVIVGTEIIAGPETDPAVFASCGTLLRKRLGRVVVACRDLPAFAGNRIGFKVLNECAILAEQHGVAFVDYLMGPYTGRAMPPLATIDLVGWDVHAAIVDNVFANTSDEAHEAFRMPAYMRTLMAKGHLGNKTPKQGGFFLRSKTPDGKRFKLPLDPAAMAHAQAPASVTKVRFVEEMKAMHAVGRYRDAMALFLRAEGPEAQLARKVILGYVSYALHRVGPDEVVDTPAGVDGIMGFGFNWAPPSVLVDLFGPKPTMAAMREVGLPVPPVLASLPDGERMFTLRGANIGRFFVGK